MTGFTDTLAFAKQLDQEDPLHKYRSQFLFPKVDGKAAIYLCGNSLGLQPKSAKDFVMQELDDWATLGVEGHFHAKHPWLYYHRFFKKSLARLVGAKPDEVVAMNQLTVNLHLLMTTFYRPDQRRFKIITEAGAFSSDQYAFESQIRLHGLNPDEVLIEVKPRDGEFTLRTQDILQTIYTHGSQTALVIFGGVQYYTGQFFDIASIAKAAREQGAYVGFDLAHAIGNVPLNLHNDDVDFAVWCSYKYLNSGPGGVAGAFIHERHAINSTLPRMAGWWGHNESVRFEMKKGFIPMPGAEGWQLSNFPVISGAVQLASLKLFDEVGMKALRKKSIALTGYLAFLLQSIPEAEENFQVITPGNTGERGCQLSILMKKKGKTVFNKITKAGVIADWREPNVIRIAPVPLYNSFTDVFRFVSILKQAIK